MLNLEKALRLTHVPLENQGHWLNLRAHQVVVSWPERVSRTAERALSLTQRSTPASRTHLSTSIMISFSIDIVMAQRLLASTLRQRKRTRSSHTRAATCLLSRKVTSSSLRNEESWVTNTFSF